MLILLLGGTQETAGLATLLANAGCRVLVSTATGIALDVGCHRSIRRRTGRLDAAAMEALLREEGVRAVVDATHPYAIEVRETARSAAETLQIPYFTWVRPGLLEDGGEDLIFADDHEQAARAACRAGGRVLLTTGSRNLAPYVTQSRRTGVDLVVRVLDHEDSLAACREAGLARDRVLTGRGPFSVEQNREAIRRFGITVVVTKDSGAAGGVDAKLEAARAEGCRIVVVRRPAGTRERVFDTQVALIQEVLRRVRGHSAGTDQTDSDPRASGSDPVERPRTPELLLALDLESVLVPEIWTAVARRFGVPDLALTTREVADYDALMRRRIALTREHGLTLADLRHAVEELDPLPGAADFLAWAQRRFPVALVSDTFRELAAPLLERLGHPMLLCHSLEVDAAGRVSAWRQRQPNAKREAVRAFRSLGYLVAAVGDSHNDLDMLDEADAAFLFRPPPGLAHGRAQVVETYDDLRQALNRRGCGGDDAAAAPRFARPLRRSPSPSVESRAQSQPPDCGRHPAHTGEGETTGGR